MLSLLLQSVVSEDDLVSEISSDLQVTVDRWAAGQLGLSDLLIAAGLIVAAAASAWLVRRLTDRSTAGLEGPAVTARVVAGQVSLLPSTSSRWH